MNSITKLQSNVDDAIRSDPELLEAIQIATEQLTTFTDQLGATPTLTWRLPHADEPVIELTMSESTPNGSGTARRRYPLRYMKDPINRDISVMQVWSDLLGERRKRRSKSIERLIEQLEEEEKNGSAVSS